MYLQPEEQSQQEERGLFSPRAASDIPPGAGRSPVFSAALPGTLTLRARLLEPKPYLFPCDLFVL